MSVEFKIKRALHTNLTRRVKEKMHKYSNAELLEIIVYLEKEFDKVLDTEV